MSPHPLIKPAAPHPSLVRAVISQIHSRARYFDADLLCAPIWNMMLDLTAAHGEGRPISVTSLCIASGAPDTTALRHIRHMSARGVINRTPDPFDRRRDYVSLSDWALDAMHRYFVEVIA